MSTCRSGLNVRSTPAIVPLDRAECDQLAEDRCSTIKAKAARLWLYENNMTYRKYYDLHRSILNDFNSTHPSRRMELYEPTHSLLMKLPGIEVAAWPILYPWSRYGEWLPSSGDYAVTYGCRCG